MHERLWERFLGALDGKLPPQALDTWIRPGRLLAHPGFLTAIDPTRDGVAVALRL